MKVLMKVKIFELIIIFMLIFVNFVEPKPTPSPQFPFTVLTTKRPRPNQPNRPQQLPCKDLIMFFD